MLSDLIRVADSMPPDVLDVLGRCPAFPASAFGDPGVHTGNSAALLIHAAPPADAHVAPIRQGRDIRRYRLADPSHWLRLDAPPVDGHYWRIGPIDRYRHAAILSRQTANRPMGALHADPAYFRNSVLACHGAPGVDDYTILAILNSTLIGCLHRATLGDASQRAFPQVKVRHLRRLPLPTGLHGPDPADAAVRTWVHRALTGHDGPELADSAVIGDNGPQAIGQAMATLARRRCQAIPADVADRLDRLIDRLVCRLYGLTPAQADAVDRLARRLTW